MDNVLRDLVEQLRWGPLDQNGGLAGGVNAGRLWIATTLIGRGAGRMYRGQQMSLLRLP